MATASPVGPINSICETAIYHRKYFYLSTSWIYTVNKGRRTYGRACMRIGVPPNAALIPLSNLVNIVNSMLRFKYVQRLTLSIQADMV